MYSKKHGYSKTVTLIEFRKRLSGQEDNALTMVAHRTFKSMDLNKRIGEGILTYSSSECTKIQMEYYPLHRTKRQCDALERRASELAAKFWGQLQPFIR